MMMAMAIARVMVVEMMIVTLIKRLYIYIIDRFTEENTLADGRAYIGDIWGTDLANSYITTKVMKLEI
jgi:hypothetical protein